MTRANAVCVMGLAVCLTTSTSAQDLSPGEIVSEGQNTYRIRVFNERLDIAEAQAKKRASEYCIRMKKTMVVENGIWNMGYGYLLIWRCIPPQHPPPER
jgi:hypothetical protein